MLICCNSFHRIRWINEFGGLTGCSLVLNCTLYWYWEIVADYKGWQINWWWINKNSLYINMNTCIKHRLVKM